MRITLIYLFFGSLWILLSDRLLYALVQSVELQEKIQTYKGWCFVAATAALYYFLLRVEISRRRKARADLQALNAELEARVTSRTEDLEAFSYSVSHDLRAPLRAIEAFASMLTSDHASALDPEGKKLLDSISRKTLDMGRLIEALLAFSRASRKAFAKEDVDMNALAREAWRETAPGSNPPAFTLAQLPPACGDRDMLRQVWVNLLSNAVKFTSRTPGAAVSVSAAVEGGFTVYTVRDNGAGFDPALAERLFGIFQRLHRDNEFPGSGLGLAVTKRIVLRHGGLVWAEGEPGKGASFHFSLPAPAAHP